MPSSLVSASLRHCFDFDCFIILSCLSPTRHAFELDRFHLLGFVRFNFEPFSIACFCCFGKDFHLQVIFLSKLFISYIFIVIFDFIFLSSCRLSPAGAAYDAHTVINIHFRIFIWLRIDNAFGLSRRLLFHIFKGLSADTHTLYFDLLKFLASLVFECLCLMLLLPGQLFLARLSAQESLLFICHLPLSCFAAAFNDRALHRFHIYDWYERAQRGFIWRRHVLFFLPLLLSHASSPIALSWYRFAASRYCLFDGQMRHIDAYSSFCPPLLH